MAGFSFVATEMTKLNVGYWSIDQLEWLDEHYSTYETLHKQSDLSSFWPSLFTNFFKRWPIHKTSSPTMRKTHQLSNTEDYSLSEAEKQCKFISVLSIKNIFHYKPFSLVKNIQSFFNNKRTLQGTALLALVVGDWTNEQIDWLNDHRTSYLAARKDDEFSTFWNFLSYEFLSLWPVRDVLWPTMPDNKPDTLSQQRFVFEAEAQRKLASIFLSIILIIIWLLLLSDSSVLKSILNKRELVKSISGSTSTYWRPEFLQEHLHSQRFVLHVHTCSNRLFCKALDYLWQTCLTLVQHS